MVECLQYVSFAIIYDLTEWESLYGVCVYIVWSSSMSGALIVGCSYFTQGAVRSVNHDHNAIGYLGLFHWLTV